MDKILYIANSLASVFGSRLLPQYSSKEIADYQNKRNSTTTSTTTNTTKIFDHNQTQHDQNNP